jgi:hypothetical protein
MKQHIRNSLVFFMIFQVFLITGLVPGARAAIVSTQTLIESSRTDNTRSRIQAMLSREDVRTELVRMGVAQGEAEKRLAALTPAELLQLQRYMDELPAGAGALEVIGIVFLVLLILELVGVTNIFNKI